MQDKAKLTAPEIERYKRHIVLKEVGGQGQQRFKAAAGRPAFHPQATVGTRPGSPFLVSPVACCV